MEELEKVLDLYDESRVTEERDADVVAREAREQFSLDFQAFREDLLRGSLEEVVWRLTQRGHSAWIEDGEIDQPAEPVRGSPSGKLHSLRLCVLPAGSAHERTGTPRVEFTPDVSHQVVRVEIDLADGREVQLLEPFALEELDERTIVELAVRLVGPVLLDEPPAEPPLRRRGLGRSAKEEPPEPPQAQAQALERQWTDTGLSERWLDSMEDPHPD